MKRVTLFNNGSDVDGKAVVITHSFEELIAVATKKCGIPVKRIFTAQGGEIDEIELIRDDDILYVSAGESFVRMENKSTQSSDSFPCATQGQVPVKKSRLSSTASRIQNPFESILNEIWFVDKTPLIAAVVDILLPRSTSGKLRERDPLLITAPRRFGKTTNLQMLLSFFSGSVAKEKFTKLKIGESTSMDWWGKFNVIYVTFGYAEADIRCKEDCVRACRSILHESFKNVAHIVHDLPESGVTAFNKWLDEELYLQKTDAEVAAGLRFLVQCISRYDKPILLLVDEFDRICASAFGKTESDELDLIVSFYCTLIGNVIKHEPQCVAVLTGVTAITCKGLSASLNNINWCRFLEDEVFSKFYGITRDEFEDIMKRPNIPKEVLDLKEEAIKWYNGYKAFDCEILNTYSVKKFIENKEVRPYWKQSSSADVMNEKIFQEKLVRDQIMTLLDDEPMPMNFEETLKAKHFCLIQNEAYKVNNLDFIMNYLLQQGYVTIIGDRTPNPVEIRIPNEEVKLEFSGLIAEYYVQIFKFDPKKIELCRNYFINMDMSDEKSCEQDLKHVKRIINELLSRTRMSELNEAWFESFLFQIFFQNFNIHQQKKVAGTSKKKDRRFWKVLDLCITAQDRCFIFEETCEGTAEKALQKLLKKHYYKIVEESKPFVLIGINVKGVENTPIVSMNYLFNKKSGEGKEV